MDVFKSDQKSDFPENLLVERDRRTAGVYLNRNGVLYFSGRSIPYHVLETYAMVSAWIFDYCRNPVAKTTLSFSMEYLNSGSLKYFLQLMIHLKEADTQLEVVWYYEEDDEEMEDTVEHLREITGIPINMIMVKRFESDINDPFSF